MNYYVYILLCADKTLYCGSSNNVEKRLREHNGETSGGAKYTRSRKPVRLVHMEKFQSVTDALKREYEIKKYTKKKKLDLVNSNKS